MNKMRLFLMAAILACPLLPTSNAFASEEIVLNSAIEWSPLNPARGDKSPQAGQLWGDRTKEGPSGFLVKFVDGFSSPPHIHNVTYKGVVISGLVHNDDPEAANMWMPAGSFWTQPAGEAHITSAKGDINIAYIEIENGPYLVQHAHEQFDNGERPINVDPSNLVWLGASDTKWIEGSSAKVAHLWGRIEDGQLSGSLIKLSEDFSGSIQNDGTDFRAIVISGQVQHESTALTAGSYFGANEAKTHTISTNEETVIYVRTNGKYVVSKYKE